MKKLKVTKKKIIILVIIVIIGIVIFNNNTNKQEEVVQYELEEIEKRTVAKTVSATGVINSTNTNFNTYRLRNTFCKCKKRR